jgi:flagellar basal-body rod protein FlgC
MLEKVSAKEIAVSGLKAQRARMNVIANNVANIMTTRTRKGGAFRRQMAVLRGNQVRPTMRPGDYGVRVKRIISDPSPFRLVYEPNHPDANEDGYVEYPNVNLSVEMVDLVAAQRAYDANVSVILSSKRMAQKALEIIQV